MDGSDRNRDVGIPRGWGVVRVDQDGNPNRVATMSFQRILLVSRVLWLCLAFIVAVWIIAVEVHIVAIKSASVTPEEIVNEALRKAIER